MIAEQNIVVDGIHYYPGDEIWELGSLECVAIDGGKRKYHGFSSDISKLPNYVDAGSTCLMLDTGDFYIFHGIEKPWNRIDDMIVSPDGLIPAEGGSF